MAHRTAETVEFPAQLLRERLSQLRVFEFRHGGKKIKVEITASKKFLFTNRCNLDIFIKIDKNRRATKNEEPLGEIRGILRISRNKQREFFVDSSDNHKVFSGYGPPEKHRGHIPYLVRETIAQFLEHQIIHVWHSSYILTEGGEKMYAALLRDSRLEGEKSALSNRITLKKK